MASNVLKFEGSNYLRQRLILSTLSGKPVRIIKIRAHSDNPGLQEYEINLIRLLDKITNGSNVEVNETGTLLFYQPGILYGGYLEHECSKFKSIGYYLEMLIALGPFCKKPLQIKLFGVTNNQEDPSVDQIKYGAIPILKKFLFAVDGLELEIKKRGMAPEGGGEVFFSCPIKRQLKSIQNLDCGKIKRIRGIVYAVRVSPKIANRIVDTAKGILLKFIPDVYIHTDHNQGNKSGKSPGFGITLVAETLTDVFYTGEMLSNPSGSNDISIPEDIAKQAAYNLLEEIFRGGCVDSTFQGLAALFMTLGPNDVSKYKTGPLSPYTIQFLRNIREFFGIHFKLDTYNKTEEEEDLNLGSNKVILTCLGIGYTNLSKKHS